MTDTLNHQMFKLAAPGCGVIAFAPTDNPRALTVILSERAANVGSGKGITGGGFVECGPIAKQPAGTISLSADEAYRECCEENRGFDTIISRDDFVDRAQVVESFAVSSADANGVHACTYFALRLTLDEWRRVMALPPSEERVGDLVAATLRWTEASLKAENPADRFDMDGKDRFFHAHELLAFAAMAQLAEKGRLF